jgi:hypothetical protein
MDEGGDQMTRLIQILSGPHDDDGQFWNSCLVTDGRYDWSEDIYYDTLCDAITEFEDLREFGYIELEDEEDE